MVFLWIGDKNTWIEILLCVVSKDTITLFPYSWHLQPTKNSSFLVDENYSNFHSVHQPENDINYWHLWIFACAIDIRNKWIEILLYVVSKDIIPIFPSSRHDLFQPRRPLFLHALSFECTSKLCGTFLNQFSDYFYI